jgi:hypothetical protein
MAIPINRSPRTSKGLMAALAMCAAVSACGGSTGGAGSPLPPTPSGLAGEWSGTTDQGRQITFSVSPDQRVTAIAFDYIFPDCSGAVTLSNENIFPFTGLPTPGFAFGKSLESGPSGVDGKAFLMPDNSLRGGIAFYESRTCKGGATQFAATRR